MYTQAAGGQTKIATGIIGAFSHIFPAISGIQSGREFYVTMCPLNLIPKIFLFNENGLPPEFRAQRVINRARIPEIVKYIVKNPRDYTFSAITASINGRVQFQPLLSCDSEGRIGQLLIPMSAQLVINDGQHRRAAIVEALKLSPDLGGESIPVVLFADAGLKRSQQMFADLNKFAIRPTRSLGVLYDHRDPLAQLVRDLLVRVPIFTDRTEKEKTTISHRSLKLFTLSSIYQATKALLGKKRKYENVSESEGKLAQEYWTELPENIPEWKLLLRNGISSSELRKSYVNAHGVILHALGAAGHDLVQHRPDDWKTQLKCLEEIDWSRTNSEWEGRAIMGGRLSKAQINVVLATNYIKRKLGLELTSEEQKIESSHDRAVVPT